jgi:hypothetical protein
MVRPTRAICRLGARIDIKEAAWSLKNQFVTTAPSTNMTLSDFFRSPGVDVVDGCGKCGFSCELLAEVTCTPRRRSGTYSWALPVLLMRTCPLHGKLFVAIRYVLVVLDVCHIRSSSCWVPCGYFFVSQRLIRFMSAHLTAIRTLKSAVPPAGV